MTGPNAMAQAQCSTCETRVDVRIEKNSRGEDEARLVMHRVAGRFCAGSNARVVGVLPQVLRELPR